MWQREEENAQLITEPTDTENWIRIGKFTFDSKYLREKENDYSNFEQESGYPVAFSGIKWTKGKPVEFIETPQGLEGINLDDIVIGQ